MNFVKCLTAFSVFGAALGVVQPANAVTTFFGEDLNSGFNRPNSIPNSSQAKSDFLSNLQGVGTEDFESFSDGRRAPLSLSFPGAGTATLSGGDGAIETVASGMSAGRFPTSGDKLWEVRAGGSGNFAINFSDPVAAFGFHGIDIGDFGGELELVLNNGSTQTVTVPNTQGSGGSTNGSVLYHGLIADPGNEFTSINFDLTNDSDVFGFDDMTIGSREQVQVVPESSSMLGLLAVGLLGAGTTFARKKLN